MFIIKNKLTLQCLRDNNIDITTIQSKEQLDTIIKSIRKAYHKNYLNSYMRERYRTKDHERQALVYAFKHILPNF